MSFFVLNCQVVKRVDIFANPVFKNPGIKKESFSVFDFCFFSYLSVLMEKYWLRPWKAFFDAVDAE